MKHKARSLPAAVLLLATWALRSLPLSASPFFGPVVDSQVNVVVNLTEEGKAFPAPTLERPTSYRVLAGGYRELGQLVANEKSPSETEVLTQLARVLSRQHYIAAAPAGRAPDLLLVVHWGYCNPQTEQTGDFGFLYNNREMLSLVAGRSWANLNDENERKYLSQEAFEARYFVILSAYDFTDATKKKKTLLWRARMSVPSSGVEMRAAVPVLLAWGRPFFGHETVRPAILNVRMLREASVELGEPRVLHEPASNAGIDPGVLHEVFDSTGIRR